MLKEECRCVFIYAYLKNSFVLYKHKKLLVILPCSLVLDLMFDASSQPSEHFLTRMLGYSQCFLKHFWFLLSCFRQLSRPFYTWIGLAKCFLEGTYQNLSSSNTNSYFWNTSPGNVPSHPVFVWLQLWLGLKLLQFSPCQYISKSQ